MYEHHVSDVLARSSKFTHLYQPKEKNVSQKATYVFPEAKLT